MSEFGLSAHILEQITSVLKQHPLVQSASIFGSRARGDYKNYSDIDIAIYAPQMALLEVMDISAELKKLPIVFKFDIVHVDQCETKELLSKIQRDGKQIYLAGRE